MFGFVKKSYARKTFFRLPSSYGRRSKGHGNGSRRASIIRKYRLKKKKNRIRHRSLCSESDNYSTIVVFVVNYYCRDVCGRKQYSIAYRDVRYTPLDGYRKVLVALIWVSPFRPGSDRLFF